MEDIRNSLLGILRPYLRRERPLLLEVLAPFWSRIVGPEVAEHARPAAFASGTLTVETPCDVWAAQLHGLREEIRAEINSALGVPVVRRLVVRHRPAYGPARRRREDRAAGIVPANPAGA